MIAEKSRSNSPIMKRPTKFKVRKLIAFKNGVYEIGADSSPKKGEFNEAMKAKPASDGMKILTKQTFA